MAAVLILAIVASGILVFASPGGASEPPGTSATSEVVSRTAADVGWGGPILEGAAIVLAGDSLAGLLRESEALDTLIAELNAAYNLSSTGYVTLSNADLTVATLAIGMQQARVEMAKGIIKTQENQIAKAGQALQQAGTAGTSATSEVVSRTAADVGWGGPILEGAAIVLAGDSLAGLLRESEALDTLIAELNAASNLSSDGNVTLSNADLTVATLAIGMQQARVEMAKGIIKTQEMQIAKAGQALQQ